MVLHTDNSFVTFQSTDFVPSLLDVSLKRIKSTEELNSLAAHVLI